MDNPNYRYAQQSVPNATAVLVLGILSIILCGLIGLILSIIALSLANKEKANIENNPSAYTLASINNMKAGRTCAIIGVSISALVFVFLILYVLFIGALFTGLATNSGIF